MNSVDAAIKNATSACSFNLTFWILCKNIWNPVKSSLVFSISVGLTLSVWWDGPYWVHSGDALENTWIQQLYPNYSLEGDTKLRILYVSNLYYVEGSNADTGKTMLTSSACWSLWVWQPCAHTRGSQSYWTTAWLDTCVIRIKDLSNIWSHDLRNGLWLCGWFSFTSLPNLSCHSLTRLWQLLIGALYLYSPVMWNPGIDSLPCLLLFYLSPWSSWHSFCCLVFPPC